MSLSNQLHVKTSSLSEIIVVSLILFIFFCADSTSAATESSKTAMENGIHGVQGKSSQAFVLVRDVYEACV